MGRAIYLSGERFSANLVLPGDQAAGTFEILPLMSAFNAAQRVIAVGGVLVEARAPNKDVTRIRRPKASSPVSLPYGYS